MFIVIHGNYYSMGRGPTIQAAIDDWQQLNRVDVDDDIFEDLVFVEGKEIEVMRTTSYEKTGETS